MTIRKMLADESYQENFWIMIDRWVGITWFSKCEKTESKVTARGKTKNQAGLFHDSAPSQGLHNLKNWLLMKVEGQVGLKTDGNYISEEVRLLRSSPFHPAKKLNLYHLTKNWRFTFWWGWSKGIINSKDPCTVRQASL